MSSTYSSFIPDYSQSPLMTQIAQVAEGLGQQQYSWAQQQFASNSALTDNVVNNYLTASQQDMSLAQNMTDRYTNLFQPQENALVNDANTYASTGRVASEMGRAESDTAQSMDAAKANAEQTLQSYGIDPSSGRYAELDRAQDAQRAAAEAQAGQAARYNTEATGRQLRAQAIQVGQQYPGQIVNSLNNAMQGYAGAENAKLSNTNTGVNALSSADPFLNTAMSLKYPPLGSAGTHGSIMNTTANTGNSNGSAGSRAPGGGGSNNPFGSGANPGGINFGGGAGANGAGGAGAVGAGGGPGRGGTIAGITNINDPYSSQGDDSNYPGMDYTNSGAGAYGPDYSAGNPNYQSYDTFNGDWGAAQPAGNSFDNYNFQPANSANPDFGSQGFGNAGDTSGYNSGEDFGNSAPSYSSDAGAGSFQQYDSGSGFGDSSGGDSGDYAAGGAIPENGPTTGGYVPPQASPSMGQQTDDVNAHVNAGEFIVPRDVAAWKGQEFFQKLIEQSRKNLSGAPAKGKPQNRPSNGPPSFVSQSR